MQLTMLQRRDIVRRLTELGAPAVSAVAALRQAESTRRWRTLDQLLNSLGDDLTRQQAAAGQ